MNGILCDFARLTRDAWWEAALLEWIKSMAPREAVAAPMDDSVTVSIGEATQGVARATWRLSLVKRETTSVGKSMECGRKITSSLAENPGRREAVVKYVSSVHPPPIHKEEI